MASLSNITVDEFIELKDAIGDAVTTVLTDLGYDAFGDVSDESNDPNNYRKGNDLLVPLSLESN